MFDVYKTNRPIGVVVLKRQSKKRSSLPGKSNFLAKLFSFLIHTLMANARPFLTTTSFRFSFCHTLLKYNNNTLSNAIDYCHNAFHCLAARRFYRGLRVSKFTPKERTFHGHLVGIYRNISPICFTRHSP